MIKWDISHQLTPEEVEKLPESEKRYVAGLEGKLILMQPPARYVNHSCDANTHAEKFVMLRTGTLRREKRLLRIIRRLWMPMSP